MNVGYKHFWHTDYDLGSYICTVCKITITKQKLFDRLGCDELVHDCLDRIVHDKICKEPEEAKGAPDGSVSEEGE